MAVTITQLKVDGKMKALKIFDLLRTFEPMSQPNLFTSDDNKLSSCLIQQVNNIG